MNTLPRSFEEGDLVRFWTIDEAKAYGVALDRPAPELPWGEIGIIIEAGFTLPLHSKSPIVAFNGRERLVGETALTLVEAYDPTKELGEEYFA